LRGHQYTDQVAAAAQNQAIFGSDGYTDKDSFCTAAVNYFNPHGEVIFISI